MWPWALGRVRGNRDRGLRAAGRKKWLAAARQRLEEQRAEQARAIPKARQERLIEAKRRLDEDLEVECRANAAYEEYRATGRARDGKRLGKAPNPYTPPQRPEGKINTTDMDSRNVKTPRGWVQGYNAQAATNERQIVIAAELTNCSADFGQFEPVKRRCCASSSSPVSPTRQAWLSPTRGIGTTSRSTT